LDKNNAAYDFLGFCIGAVGFADAHGAAAVDHLLGRNVSQRRSDEQVATGAEFVVMLDGCVVEATHFFGCEAYEGVGGKMEKTEEFHVRSPLLDSEATSAQSLARLIF
jgi:hypothetical protein